MLSKRERVKPTEFSAILSRHDVAVVCAFGLKITVLREKSGSTSVAFTHRHIQVSVKRSDVHFHRQ